MHKVLLRGGLCAVWLVSFTLAALKFLAYAASDADAEMYAKHVVICLFVGLVAATAHAYLIHEDTKNG